MHFFKGDFGLEKEICLGIDVPSCSHKAVSERCGIYNSGDEQLSFFDRLERRDLANSAEDLHSFYLCVILCDDV